MVPPNIWTVSIRGNIPIYTPTALNPGNGARVGQESLGANIANVGETLTTKVGVSEGSRFSNFKFRVGRVDLGFKITARRSGTKGFGLSTGLADQRYGGFLCLLRLRVSGLELAPRMLAQLSSSPPSPFFALVMKSQVHDLCEDVKTLLDAWVAPIRW